MDKRFSWFESFIAEMASGGTALALSVVMQISGIVTVIVIWLVCAIACKRAKLIPFAVGLVSVITSYFFACADLYYGYGGYVSLFIATCYHFVCLCLLSVICTVGIVISDAVFKRKQVYVQKQPVTDVLIKSNVKRYFENKRKNENVETVKCVSKQSSCEINTDYVLNVIGVAKLKNLTYDELQAVRDVEFLLMKSGGTFTEREKKILQSAVFKLSKRVDAGVTVTV